MNEEPFCFVVERPQMSDGEREHYKALMEAHRFASEFRWKQLSGGAAGIAALVAAGGWALNEIPEVAFVFPLLASFGAAVLIAADRRHSHSIGSAVKCCMAFENAFPNGYKFFYGNWNKGEPEWADVRKRKDPLRYGVVVGVSLVLLALVLFGASVYLFVSRSLGGKGDRAEAVGLTTEAMVPEGDGRARISVQVPSGAGGWSNVAQVLVCVPTNGVKLEVKVKERR